MRTLYPVIRLKPPREESSHTPDATPSFESAIQSLKGRGQPLVKSTRSFFELRFGNDFSRVRVHTDSRAAQNAAELNVRAFTFENHMVFGAGQYAPATHEGPLLLAHELAHVLQQSDDQSVTGSSMSITLVTTRNGILLLQREFERTILAGYLGESFN